MLKELFSYMKQYKKYAWISLVCIAVECIFELVIPLIMADMVDVGIANGDQDYILPVYLPHDLTSHHLSP